MYGYRAAVLTAVYIYTRIPYAAARGAGNPLYTRAPCQCCSPLLPFSALWGPQTVHQGASTHSPTTTMGACLRLLLLQCTRHGSHKPIGLISLLSPVIQYGSESLIA